MRRTVRNVTLVLFLLVVVGCGFAVLYLGTSTGLTFGGGATRMLAQDGSHPLYGQVGWLRNTAPWPITITNVTTNVENAADAPDVYLEREQTTPTTVSSKEPVWAQNASKVPFQLDGSALRYLAFAVSPQKDAVASMTSITVTYKGPLGLTFHSTFGGTRVVVASSTLPGGVLGADPASHSESLDAYISSIRDSLSQPDTKTIALLMGNNATEAQAQAFITSQKGYVATDGVNATWITKDGHDQHIFFYKGDPVKGALPQIEVVWSNYRWTIVPPPS